MGTLLLVTGRRVVSLGNRLQLRGEVRVRAEAMDSTFEELDEFFYIFVIMEAVVSCRDVFPCRSPLGQFGTLFQAQVGDVVREVGTRLVVEC